MPFPAKFKALLSLTATKSINLADHVGVDAAVISRMKTGARKMPKDKKLLQNICRYLAGRFDTEYRRSALYELTSDIRLQSSSDINTLTTVIFDWLTAPEELTFV